MNLLETLETIWSVKVRAVLLAVLAAAVAVLLTFHVSFSPFRLHARALQLGVAQTGVLVDSGRSPLADAQVPLENVAPGVKLPLIRPPLEDLTTVAANYAELINSPLLIGPIAHSVGVRPADIGVQEQLLQNVALAQTDAREPQVGSQILATQRRYFVLVRHDQGTFVVQIYTQAPDSDQAIRMANAAAAALSRYAASVARYQSIKPGQRVILRQLGTATGGTIDQGVSRDAAILGGVAIWIFGMIALLTLRRLRLRRRASSTQLAASTR